MLNIKRTIQHHITVTKEQQTFARDLINLFYDARTNFMDDKESFFSFVDAIAEKDEEFYHGDDEVTFFYEEEEDDC